MTMATTTMTNNPGATGSGRTLEELVDRVFEALLGASLETSVEAQSVSRLVHEARRLRQQGDLDGALAVLASVDLAGATEREVRWVYGEWLDIARRRFRGREGAVVYSPGTGRATVLAPHPGGALEALAVLGLRWPVGKLVSRRSLRGLRPLAKGGSQ